MHSIQILYFPLSAHKNSTRHEISHVYHVPSCALLMILEYSSHTHGKWSSAGMLHGGRPVRYWFFAQLLRANPELKQYHKETAL